jgi:prepilin-type N-terminal cleavage/methylation domain-containing protein
MITRKHKQCSTQPRQSGFTIVESLMAVVVVAVLMTAIAPVIVLSAATRVQSKRVELATQAAKTYVDGLRSGAIAAPSNTVQLPTSQHFFQNVAAPGSSTAGLASLYCVDLDNLDGDGVSLGDTDGCTATSSKDLAIQAFRSVTPTSNNADDGYRLGLRVYRADAFNDNSPLKGNGVPAGSKVKQATFTGGLGNRKAPLIETTTEIFVTNRTTYRDYCNRLGGC